MKVYHLILIGQFIWLMVVRFDSVSAFQSTAPSHQCYRFAKVPGDPCAKLNCEFGAECVVARGARNASCQCIEQCYTYGDTVDSGPVCGSDGVDYASLCELRRASCAKLEYISIQFDGKCDPCTDHTCEARQTCMVDDQRRPHCRCDDTCDSTLFDPVCGSDGHTYPNECVLRVQACKERRPIRILQAGDCAQSSEARNCESLNCTGYQECDVGIGGTATCVCPSQCPMILAPVCGNDHRTYSSECELKRRSCETPQSNLHMLYRGACSTASACEQAACEHGAVCVSGQDHRTGCQCATTCPPYHRPVCGSDGRTYANKCELERHACLRQTPITLAQLGVCPGCEYVKCAHFSTCRAITLPPSEPGSTSIGNMKTLGRCECWFDCVAGLDRPVCGSDGRTYANDCELRRHACETQNVALFRLSDGVCDVCTNVKCKYNARCHRGKCVCPTDCPTDASEPVCSSTGKTFANECELRKFACDQVRSGSLHSMWTDETSGSSTSNPLAGTQNQSDWLSADQLDQLDSIGVAFFGDCLLLTTTKSAGAHLFGGLSPSSSSHSISKNQTLNLNDTTNGSANASTNNASSASGGYATRCDSNSCKFGGVCAYNEQQMPICVCSFDCPADDDEQSMSDGVESLCGSDGRLYLNECKLQEEACVRQQSIAVVNKNRCASIERIVTLSNVTSGYSGFISGSTATLGAAVQSTAAPNPTSTSDLHPSEEQALRRCSCNRLGTQRPFDCQPEGQCNCRPGVGGKRCDRCEPGFWAMHKLSQGTSGCLPCECNALGSVREDCEQQSGRCACRPGTNGMKCDQCPAGKKLTALGCVDENLFKIHSGRCTESKCKYGATCRELGGRKWQCACEYDCEANDSHVRRSRDAELEQMNISAEQRNDSQDSLWANPELEQFPELKSRVQKHKNRRSASRMNVHHPHQQSNRQHHGPVCGSDRITYSSECSLNAFQCRLQRRIVKVHDHACNRSSKSNYPNRSGFSSGGSSVTQQPVRRSTLDRQTTHEPNTFMDTSIDDSSSLFHGLPTQSSVIDSVEAKLHPTTTSGRSFHTDTNQIPAIPQSLKSPLFTGRSWARFERLRAYKSLSVDFKIIPYSDTGMLLYNGQSPTGQGDFVSLALNQAFVEFRFNLGSGSTLLRSSARIKKYRPFHIQVQRSGRQAWLRVDGQPIQNVTAEGQLSSLDLNEHLFLGYIPNAADRVWENIALTGNFKLGGGVNSVIGSGNSLIGSFGFVGCILDVRINSKRLRFGHNGPEAADDEMTYESNSLHSHEIVASATVSSKKLDDLSMIRTDESTDRLTSQANRLQASNLWAECAQQRSLMVGNRTVNVCEQHNPCVRPSACLNLASGSFDCVCPHDVSSGCWAIDASGQKSIERSPIDFLADSYLQLHTLTNVAAGFVIELWFFPRAASGLLLYNGQRSTQSHSGDFVALQLINSHAQFVFDLGSRIPNQSGVLQIKSRTKVRMNGWNKIRITRMQTIASLQLNDDSIIFDEAKGNLNELNLDEPFFIGGLPNTYVPSAQLPAPRRGFDGALQRIVLNGEHLSGDQLLARSVRMHNVPSYLGAPCESSTGNVCLNGGRCVPLLAQFVCECVNEFDGNHCELTNLAEFL